MSRPAISESYFQTELAKRARSDQFAAPILGDALQKKLDYLTADQFHAVEQAYAYADHAHQGQQRRTGHDYITHPLAVAGILASFRMDSETICAGLLHDVLEDTQVNRKTLTHTFGEQVASIVDGVSKLSHAFESQSEAQAQNFHKMALAMARDLRVIVVKLADRLHNMRTIGALERGALKRIARETLDLFVPIANRLGIYVVKEELEKLAFEALYPLRSDRLQRLVATHAKRYRASIEELRKSLHARLADAGVAADVTYEDKNVYDIYSTLRAREKTFDDIMDVHGFRVVVKDVDECYRTLGIVHSLYKPKLRSFKDYIAIPKSNGYQSLHTTVVGPKAQSVQLRIRSSRMDDVANYGFVAGFRQAEVGDAHEDNGEDSNDAREWIKTLLSLQEAGDAVEFLENLKTDLFPDQVYVFTPEGKILTLPSGSCVLDFAYAVHTDVGNECVACRVDGEIASLSTHLESGQTVTIIRANTARPDPNWLNHVRTAKARSAIRARLAILERKEAVLLGQNLLNRSLGNVNVSMDDLDFRRIRRVFKHFQVRKIDDLLEEIGKGNLMAYQVAEKLLDADDADHDLSSIEHGGPIVVRGRDGAAVRYGHCCGPVPGDRVVGHISQGDGLVIHRAFCGNVKNIEAKSSLVPVHWTDNTDEEFFTRLRINVTPHRGVIASLAATANALGAGIDTVQISEETSEHSTVFMHIVVRDLKHVRRVMKALLAMEDTQSVQRFTN